MDAIAAGENTPELEKNTLKHLREGGTYGAEALFEQFERAPKGHDSLVQCVLYWTSFEPSGGWVPFLERSLSDRDRRVRLFAARTLGGLGQPARTSLPLLCRSLNDLGLTAHIAIERLEGRWPDTDGSSAVWPDQVLVTGKCMTGLAAADNGDIYWVSSYHQEFGVYHPDSGRLDVLAGANEVGRAHACCWHQGKVYIIDGGSSSFLQPARTKDGRLLVYDTETRTIEVLLTDLVEPSSVTMTPDAQVCYVQDHAVGVAGSVMNVTLFDTKSKQAQIILPDLKFPSTAVMDSHGQLYVGAMSNDETGFVSRYPARSMQPDQVVDYLSNPTCAVTGPDGAIYITGSGDKPFGMLTLTRLWPQQARIELLQRGLPGLAVTVDPSGKVYYSCLDGHVFIKSTLRLLNSENHPIATVGY